DVAAAVVLVPFRGGKLQEVHVPAAVDVFHHRPVLDHLGRDRTEAAFFLLPQREELLEPSIGRQAERVRETLWPAERVGEDAVARGVSRYVVEQQRGAVPVHGDLGDDADLDVPIGLVDGLELAELFHLSHPGPHVTVTHRVSLAFTVSVTATPVGRRLRTSPRPCPWSQTRPRSRAAAAGTSGLPARAASPWRCSAAGPGSSARTRARCSRNGCGSPSPAR